MLVFELGHFHKGHLLTNACLFSVEGLGVDRSGHCGGLSLGEKPNSCGWDSAELQIRCQQLELRIKRVSIHL